MVNKIQYRKKRALKTRNIINRHSNRPRLVIYKSCVHIYSQIVKYNISGNIVIVSASTRDKEIRPNIQGKNKVLQAKQVGIILGIRAKNKNLNKIAFDRSGYKYHGRIKALADGARESGLNF